ncbi:TetR/AcrR family transcriptional regulator [Sediminivirga luteola]|uniref:TetR family transcriptional regulator n=1 Tax=Sediminivirga luteola TaxID=1774748 RepID=A0A8J2XJL3_9MICO|nr:TetR/AcrR family transcriptional regulator [Sediminivirga luteola]MCI2265672.1 TetR/AcrR family transcriptional regulator [Sediminivirga luteola]GGA07498.1 TetR family transcriptional regulator [Sediminivirga luteola]
MAPSPQNDPAQQLHGTKTNRGPSAAAENRRALLEAARAEFASSGAAVPLSRIARRAGVGQGSLYRHFSDRADLAAAVFEQDLRDAALRTGATDRPYTALLDSIEARASEAAAMIELVSSAKSRQRGGALSAQLSELVGHVHARGISTGELSPRSSADELLTAIPMLALSVARSPAGERGATARRARRILDAWFLA